MKKELALNQRIIISIFYLCLIVSLGYYLSNDFDFLTNNSNPLYILFIASALMLILGSYVTEPFFTKPVDVIVKTSAILLFLIGIPNKSELFLYPYFFYLNLILLVTSILIIFTQNLQKFEKVQKFIYEIITKISKPRIIFSILYLLGLVSYFKDNDKKFVVLFGLWLILVFKTPIESLSSFILKIFKLFRTTNKNQKSIGEAIGCENPFLYTVEIDFSKYGPQKILKNQLAFLELENNIGLIGVVFREMQLLNKKWVSIYLLKNEQNQLIKIDLKSRNMITDSKCIFTKNKQFFILDFEQLNGKIKDTISRNFIYKNLSNFVGYISKDSNINKIKFQLILDDNNINIGEGSILKSQIYHEEALFQVIDGITVEENLEKFNKYGYTSVIAKKLGKYNQDKEELNTIKWLPEIFSPVFSFKSEINEKNHNDFIGRLPNTNLVIPIKDYDALVTHNTAILGILGIGKSVLTFELLKKIIENTNVKIICIDITNQYASKERVLPQYIKALLINSDIKSIQEVTDNAEIRTEDSETDGGNLSKLKEVLGTDLKKFMSSDKRIRIINPNEIIAIKQRENAKNRCKNGKWEMYAPFSETSMVETAQLIAEVSLDICKKEGLSDEAKLLLVFEEAHSLIPEWNSAVEKNDINATNATAKVILQGRKYGLGSLVITQRTANISKSILNQCNTIFALRVFDDTGKQFLENYIGSDYANTLPSLEERHAIVVGKALKLKQPVIIQLNDMNDIIKKA